MIEAVAGARVARTDFELCVARALHASHLGTPGRTCLMCRLDARVVIQAVTELGLICAYVAQQASGS